MAYQMAATAVTSLKVIHRLQTFLNVLRRTFVQHFTRFQLTVCSRTVTVHVRQLSFLYESEDNTDKRIVNARNTESG